MSLKVMARRSQTRKEEKGQTFTIAHSGISYILYPVSCILYPVSCILYPISYILYPALQTPNSKFHTPNSKLRTPLTTLTANPHPSTLNPQPSTLKTLNPAGSTGSYSWSPNTRTSSGSPRCPSP